MRRPPQTLLLRVSTSVERRAPLELGCHPVGAGGSRARPFGSLMAALERGLAKLSPRSLRCRITGPTVSSGTLLLKRQELPHAELALLFGPVTGAKQQGGRRLSSGRPPTYPIESVDNALRLLLMVTERKQIRVSEAAADLGIAASTAHRLLAMLAHHGFVVQDADTKAYRAGPVLLRVGLLVTQSLEIRTLVLPFLELLRDETGETAHAAVLQGNEMLFIACAESQNALRVASRVGTLMWAHCTSIGKAWLACEDDGFVRALYRSAKLPTLTSNSLSTRDDLLEELDRVRHSGFARNIGESEVGIGSVSAAVRDEAGRPVVAVSVSVPLARTSDERWDVLVEAMLDARASVEGALQGLGSAADA